MPSLAKKSWTSALRFRRDGSSLAQPEAGPSTPPQGTSPSNTAREGKSHASEKSREKHDSRAKCDQKSSNDDASSTYSTRPPSYRSEATVSLPEYVQTHPIPRISARGALPIRMKLESLPVPILEEIDSYLSVSSHLCLRCTSKIFLASLPQPSNTLLGLENFLSCPRMI
jgi:hypothetical protein